MGATIEWEGNTQTVTATQGSNIVILTIGNTSPTVNGRITTIDQAAVIVDSRTLAPFGGTVEWDAQNRIASIASPSKAPWAQPQFQNQNVRANATTNRALMIDYQRFNDDHAQHSTNPYPRWAGDHKDTLSAEDIRLKNQFIETVVRAWDRDTMTQVMPFNSAYLRAVLNDIDIIFAERTGSFGMFNGYYYNQGTNGRKQMFIASYDPANWEPIDYPHFAHEFGRALGLESSLTRLFSSSFSGEYLSDLPATRDMHYTIGFDRTLLNSVGDASQFWNAAFTSNAEYAKLWDVHIKEISFNDIQIARGMIATFHEYPPSYLQYQQAGGRLSLDELGRIPDRFANTFDPTLSRQGNSTERSRLVSDLAVIVNLGKQMGAFPMVAVRDEIIQSSPVRQRSNEQDPFIDRQPLRTDGYITKGMAWEVTAHS
jgi:hypothetical protein